MWCVVLCCDVLCCVVLCCVVMWCVMLWCVVLCCDVLCCVMLRCVMLCYSVLWLWCRLYYASCAIFILCGTVVYCFVLPCFVFGLRLADLLWFQSSTNSVTLYFFAFSRRRLHYQNASKQTPLTGPRSVKPRKHTPAHVTTTCNNWSTL